MQKTTIELKHPIAVKGQEVGRLTLQRRMNMGDIRAIRHLMPTDPIFCPHCKKGIDQTRGGDEIELLCVMLERLTGLTSDEVDLIDAEDLMGSVSETLTPFLSGI